MKGYLYSPNVPVYEAYNESDVFIDAVERCAKREGRYPERVLVDHIYRNRKNLAYCKEHGIRMSEPLLGRPGKDSSVRKEERRIAYRDNTDRIAVERAFALAKHSYGLGLITARLDATTRNAIAMSVLAMNVDRIVAKRTNLLLCALCTLAENTITWLRQKEEGLGCWWPVAC